MSPEWSKYDRVMAAMDHRQPDKTPAFLLGADFCFYPQFIDKVGFTAEELSQYAKDGILQTPPMNHAMAVKLGFDSDWITLTGREYLHTDTTQFVDAFGSIGCSSVQPNGIPHLWYLGPALTSEDKIKEWWDMGRPGQVYGDFLIRPAINTMRTLMKKYDGFLTMIGLPGPFENLQMAIGLGLLGKLCRQKPDLIKEILRKNFEAQGRGLEILTRYKPPIVMCGDDLGYSEGLQINAKYWRELVKPILKQYVEIVHNGGSKFILHCCGAIGELFPDFVELGIDGVDSLQPKLVDLPAIKAKFGDKIVLIGTIDDTDLLVNATPDQVTAETTKFVKQLGHNGGYIPGPTNFILDTKVENIQAMVAAIHSTKGD